MTNTADKRASRTQNGVRPDQLRPLNLPQPVGVELDDAQLPTAIIVACTSAAWGKGEERKVKGPQPCTSAPLPRCASQEAQGANQFKTTRQAVESILETWHVDDEWWREPVSRRYVEVILKGGKHLVLYEDLNLNDWYMQRP